MTSDDLNATLSGLLEKWQHILRLRDWDIKLQLVTTPWRKTGDIKVDAHDKKAILLINANKLENENLEEVVIHELLHLSLWGLDQMLESLLVSVFGNHPADPKYQFAYAQFMDKLEPTVEDLTKAFVSLAADNQTLSFKRVVGLLEDELKSS
jgi:hypothetical protein